ncbi:MAG: TRAP transporter large permease [Candidatus Rokubacteria bacterium]|nr:TRAP transporter large permease [Candidatus Rokubacteria bacterium]
MAESILLGALAILAMLILLALGIPVGVAMAAVGFVGMGLTANWQTALIQTQTLPYSLTAEYGFAVMPMFIFMGSLAVTAGVAEELFEVAYKWLGRLRGGMYLTTIAGQAAFGGISGSTIVDATVFTRTALPQMIRYGYPKTYAGACMVATGSFAAMIPPSITMVIYGIITEVSIGQMLIAGIVPGLVSAAFYAAAVALAVRLRPEIGPPARVQASWAERFGALRGLWVMILVFGIVMGGLYAGVFPPSGAGAAGAFGTLLVALGRRRLGWSGLWEAARASAAITCVIFTIIIGGLLFSRLLVMVGFIDAFGPLVLAATRSPVGIILLFALMYLVLGCLIDTTSMMIVTLPFVFPVIKTAGIDPIWFGVLLVKLVEIATMTPPVGLNLFAVAAAGKEHVTIEDLIRGIWPFIVLELLILAVLIGFPALSTWLPSRMLG